MPALASPVSSPESAVSPAESYPVPRGYLNVSAPKYALTDTEVVCRVHWAIEDRPVDGIVRLQVREDGEWHDVQDVRIKAGRGTFTAFADETWTYRVVPVENSTSPWAQTPASAARKIAARQVVSKTSAPKLTSNRFFTAVGSKVTLTTKWLRDGKRVTGKVKLQMNESGRRWKTVATGITRQGRATFKVAVPGSVKFRVVGASTSSHKGRVRVGATYGVSPVVAVAARPVPGPPKDSFVFTGSGFGHGVGMSQYGAQAQALAGRSAAEILTYYYTGTAVAATTVDQVIKVQLGDPAASRTITLSEGPAAIAVDGVDSGTLADGDRIRLEATGSGGLAIVRLANDGGTQDLGSGTTLSVRAEGVAKVTGADGTYKRGTLEVSNIGGKVNVSNRVRLDTDYLYGLAEVPSSWAPAALEAQAIAARNYGVVNATSLKAACDCHLYDDTRSQVYVGWSKENEPTYGAAWKAAVDATAGLVVVGADGQPINAYYSSSTGGRTENSEDVWSTALPYTRSVDDPWSLDPAARNPNVEWTKVVPAAEVAAAFGLADVASLRVTERTAGGNAKTVEAMSSSGATAQIVRAEEIRRTFALKSAHILAITAG
jgi:SpoIID/LytB domain protein